MVDLIITPITTLTPVDELINGDSYLYLSYFDGSVYLNRRIKTEDLLKKITSVAGSLPHNWLTLDLSEAHNDALNFRFTALAANNAASRDNIVHRFGVNINANGDGAQEDNTEVAFSWNIEELDEVASVDIARQYQNFIDTDGTAIRPIDYNWTRGSIDTTLYTKFRSHTFEFIDSDAGATQRALIDLENNVIDITSLSIRNATNNIAAISQRNAANDAYIDLLKLNGSDIIEIGSGTFGGILLNDGVRLEGTNSIVPNVASEEISLGLTAQKLSTLNIWHSSTDPLRFRDGTNDWKIRINDTGFQIRDETTGASPLTIAPGVTSTAIWVRRITDGEETFSTIDLFRVLRLNHKDIRIRNVNGLRIGTEEDDKLGFLSNEPIVKPEITGARDDPESALAQLLAGLDLYGLITDSSTATTP